MCDDIWSAGVPAGYDTFALLMTTAVILRVEWRRPCLRFYRGSVELRYVSRAHRRARSVAVYGCIVQPTCRTAPYTATGCCALLVTFDVDCLYQPQPPHHALGHC